MKATERQGGGAAVDGAVENLLARIERDVQDSRAITGVAALNARVLAAVRKVPRQLFIPAELRHQAYCNHPLPIGCGQTISQPFIVALMTDLIRPEAADSVLEIGTGSGYQTAILAELVERVYSVEIVAELADAARHRLCRLGYDNVEVLSGNGHLGWPEHAPYDAILLTAAAPVIPPRLIAQLKVGGSLVMPLGHRYSGQDLVRARRAETGRTEVERILPVIFVPMTGSADA